MDTACASAELLLGTGRVKVFPFFGGRGDGASCRQNRGENCA